MTKRNFVTLTLLLLMFLGVGTVAFAQTSESVNFPYFGSNPPLLPCVGTACTNVCQLLELGQRVIYLLLTLAVLVFGPIFIAWGGVMVITSAGSSERVGTGKKIITGALIGISIALGSFLIVNTFFSLLNVTVGGGGGSWSSIECHVEPYTPPPQAQLPPGADCSNLPALAASYATRYPHQNSPALDALISCVKSKIPSTGPNALLDTAQIYTWDRTYDWCNYTRGERVCGSTCSHKVHSCHYGGAGGVSGAEGVDFNALGGRESELNAALMALYQNNECGMGYILYEVDHTHISTPDCSGN